MTNLIKGIVFLPIESKRQLKYEIIKSNNITERGKLGTQDFDGYIITIGYYAYKSQEAITITQSRHIPTPSPFNSHILILIVFIIYFIRLVLILSKQQIFLPTKYNLPSYIQHTSFTRNRRYIRFLILLQILLLLQRATILKNTIYPFITPPIIAFTPLYHLKNIL